MYQCHTRQGANLVKRFPNMTLWSSGQHEVTWLKNLYLYLSRGLDLVGCWLKEIQHLSPTSCEMFFFSPWMKEKFIFLLFFFFEKKKQLQQSNSGKILRNLPKLENQAWLALNMSLLDRYFWVWNQKNKSYSVRLFFISK